MALVAYLLERSAGVGIGFTQNVNGMLFIIDDSVDTTEDKIKVHATSVLSTSLNTHFSSTYFDMVREISSTFKNVNEYTMLTMPYKVGEFITLDEPSLLLMTGSHRLLMTGGKLLLVG